MPQYVFTIRAPNEDAPAERAAVLKDDTAALTYACQLAQELARSVDDQRQDDIRPMVLSIPILAACA
jgi:hypothetical protein